MDLYIYYRVRAANADALQTEVLAMQHDLARSDSVRTALKRRPNEQNGAQTWMEVYLDVKDDFELKLDQAVAASRLLLWIDGERHTEQFVDVSLCA